MTPAPKADVSLERTCPVKNKAWEPGREGALEMRGVQRGFFLSQLWGWLSGVGVPACSPPLPCCAALCKSPAVSELPCLHLRMRTGGGDAEGLLHCPLGSPGPESPIPEATFSSTACELGFYKSAPGDQLCARCPPHSHSAAPAAQACRCDLSYYRAALDPPSAACTREYRPVAPGSQVSAGEAGTGDSLGPGICLGPGVTLTLPPCP